MRQQALIEMTGYLSKDGDLRRTRDGRAVLALTMPYTRRKRNPQTGDYQDAAPTVWAQFTLWDDAALHYADRMKKSTPVTVKGIPSLRTWEKDGRSGVNLEIEFPQVALVLEPPRQQQQQQQPAQQQSTDDAWATPGDWSRMDDTPF